MKKYIKIWFLVGLSTGLVGCTDLEPTLYSNLTTANAYSTETDIDAALVGVYADLKGSNSYFYYAGYNVMITDYATDMGFSTAAGDPTKLSNMTYDTSNRYFKWNWRCMYQVISNTNVLLPNIDNIDMDEEKRAQIIGQAKFLRALSYRDLTDAFGPVPLLKEPIDPIQANDMPLTSVEDIDTFLIEELKECIEVLPERWEGTDLSRATKGAAATLLAKIYLRSHKYQEAKIYIDMVLALRNKGVYILNPDFKNVWSNNNKSDAGSIFRILHEEVSNGALIAAHFGPQDHPEVPSRWQFYAVSLPYWRSYSDLDPRKEFFYYNYGGNAQRDKDTKYGFYYMLPEVGQVVPPNDTTKLLVNVATKKYTYELDSESYGDGRTISIFRISDVILCKAEIENNLNGPSAALPYLNEIRKRAGAPEYGKHVDFPAPSSTESMNQVILDERGFELVFEYQRKADLIRFGKYEETVNNHLKDLGISSPTNVTPSLRYFPYPLDDANLNTHMADKNPERVPK